MDLWTVYHFYYVCFIITDSLAISAFINANVASCDSFSLLLV